MLEKLTKLEELGEDQLSLPGPCAQCEMQPHGKPFNNVSWGPWGAGTGNKARGGNWNEKAGHMQIVWIFWAVLAGIKIEKEE